LISLCSHQDPLRSNGHWFPCVYIKTLCEAMVIDFLLIISRPSARQWSLISLCHIETLYKVMVMVFLIIEAFCEAMVIFLFTSRSSARQWSLISYVTLRPSVRQWSLISLHGSPQWGHRSLYIKTLCEAMIIDFFTSRPSAKQWSSIPLHQGPLRGTGHWFLCLHQGPLWGNGHWFLCHIEALYEAMIDLFSFDIYPLLGIGLNCFFFSKSQKRK